MIDKRKIIIYALISLIMFSMTVSMVITTHKAYVGRTDKETVYDLTSGYADELYFRVITGAEQQVLALQAGEIDLIGQFVDPDLVPPLLTDPDILINQTNRRGFGHVSFNCEAAPTNWTALRAAFAHALDKDAIQQQALGGFSRPVDCPIPPSMGAWSLDNHPDFVTNYYEPDPGTGNAILDAAGFVDVDSDGWREDPNGNAIDFGIMGANVGSVIIETVLALSVDAFEDLHIKATQDLIDFNTLLARVDSGDFNAGFWAFNLGGTEPLFLENFKSDDIGNDWNFFNSTYDDYVDTMLESNNETEVYEACWNAQRILWEEQPLCVAYQNLLISAYRKDPWTGYVNTEGSGVFDTWSFLKVHLKEGFGHVSFNCEAAPTNWTALRAAFA
ncbi:MAG: ABC transporter substrate-binding protein, partial [Candidatus Hodarchaeales archaeon]